MAKIGYLGAGKLSFPIALAVEEKGHEVLVRDYASYVDEALVSKKWPFQEARVDELLQTTKIRNVELRELVNHSDIIFVGVQTPHQEIHEGIYRLSSVKSDFNYSYLEIAITQLAEELRIQKDRKPVIVVISTVLPGTIRERVLPILKPSGVSCVYNPAFPAMGTVIQDYLNPEFILIGTDDDNLNDVVYEYYNSIIPASVAQLVQMSIESAELCKVFYNVMISQKVVCSSALLELCNKIPGCNADDISGTLALATRRIASSAYTKPSFPEGGSCHPRDGIAMSWLASKLCLSYDPFGTAMQAREDQTVWLVDLIDEEVKKRSKLPLVVMGKSYKAETNIITGSASVLLGNILKERDIDFTYYDPFVEDTVKPSETDPGIFFVATNHKQFKDYQFPVGSLVIDPWRFIPEQSGVEILKVGVGK